MKEEQKREEKKLAAEVVGVEPVPIEEVRKYNSLTTSPNTLSSGIGLVSHFFGSSQVTWLAKTRTFGQRIPGYFRGILDLAGYS